MRPRPLLVTILLLAVSFVAAYALRLAPLGLNVTVIGYSCAAVWSCTLYWILSALLPHVQLYLVVLLTGVLATGIEFLKLSHVSSIEAFLGNLPGILLPSPIFDRWAIPAYWLAILIAASLDAGTRSRSPQRPW